MAVRRVTIKDVAREAGVSVTTVSHALNGKGRLRASTRERVTEVAERLGYRANPAARNLVSGHAGLIAAMPSLPDDPRVRFAEFGYYTKVIGPRSGAAIARDHALVMAPPSRGGFVWDRVQPRRRDHDRPDGGRARPDGLRRQRIPFVTVGHDPKPDGRTASVAYDERQGTDLVLDHFASQGAARIALLIIPPLNVFARETTARPTAGWCRVHRRPDLTSCSRSDRLLDDREAYLAVAVAELVARGVDAVFVPIEIVGVMVLRTLQASGVGVPSDVLLATTQDAGASFDVDPPLTTLSYDYDEMGRRAAEMLLDVIKGAVREPPLMEIVSTTLERRRLLHAGGRMMGRRGASTVAALTLATLIACGGSPPPTPTADLLAGDPRPGGDADPGPRR